MGTTYYDVKFVDGTCTIAYGACDVAHFSPFADDDDAEAASEALQALVLLDQGVHPLNTQPGLTNGCPDNLGSTRCDIWTSFGIGWGLIPESETPVPYVLYSNYSNDVNPAKDIVSYASYPVAFSDLTYGDHDNWAVWALSTAPDLVPGPIAKSSPATEPQGNFEFRR